jgi:DNA-binding NarL/FixJ family response regulator
MINLVRHDEECRSPTVSVRSGPELVLGGRGIDDRGQLMEIRMSVKLTRLGARARVLILTTYDADRFVYEALRAGAGGFLLKTMPPDQLVSGIETGAAAGSRR